MESKCSYRIANHTGCVMHYFKGYFWNCTEISILLSGQEFCSIKVKILPSFAIMCALRINLCKFFFMLQPLTLCQCIDVINASFP